MGQANPKIFKSYDIRGIYPDELNEDAAYLIGRAFAKRALAKEVIVGSDMRLSGPALKEKLIAGIVDQGVNVIDIGLVPVDAVYFAVGILKYEAGIMITASHNPPAYNGFKMVLKDMRWIRGVELRDDVLNFSEPKAERKGEVKALDLTQKYLDHVLSFCEVKKIKPLKVVVDAGNGMAGKIVPLLQKSLPIKVIPLNFTLDGNFPAHPSNPLMPESQIQITQAVKDNKADFGVIFDGDTDRLFFVDELGQFIRADITLLLLAKDLLKREPGQGIAYNLICSKIVPEKIIEWGGRPIRTKVGYVFVSAGMRENGGIMGGELSAHYSFRDNAYADSGFIALVILLQLLSKEAKPLSEIVKPFYKYFKSDEVNIAVTDSQAIINKVKAKYCDGKQDEIDGLTVEYDNWWFNVRPSNTEPLLRITVEADSQEAVENKLMGLVDSISQSK